MDATYLASLPSSANVTRQTLDNGITVLVYERPHVQSVVMAGSLHAGSIYDANPAKNGLASITAEALMRGTQHRSFDDLHNQLETIGADLDVDSGRFKVGFDGKALAEDLPTLLELLSDVLRNPAFDQTQIERLRGQILTTLNYYEQDTPYLARRKFRQTLYPQDHPYHYGVSGTLETVPDLSVDDIRTFHAQHYGPQGMNLVIVGNVSADDAIATVAQFFGDWTNSDQPAAAAPPAAPSHTETQRVFTGVGGKTQSDIVMGTIGPSRLSDDYTAAVLANSVLGQFGMMGRIGDVVREQKGMAYYSRSSLEGGYGPGSWNAIAGVNPENVDEAVNDITEEFRRLATEPVSDEEIADVKAYFTGSLPLQLETNAGIANTLLRIESYDLGLDYLVNYHDTITSITQDDLLATAQTYINPDALVVSVAGPERS